MDVLSQALTLIEQAAVHHPLSRDTAPPEPNLAVRTISSDHAVESPFYALQTGPLPLRIN